jgi:phosphoglycerate dehydrogenase-like enzyme
MQASRFGMHVTGVRATASPHPHCSEVITTTEIDRVLPRTDFLVLACPLTEATRGLIGAAQLAALKPGAVVVNIARGQVIDQQALYAGLASGRIGGAALDVFEVEPLPQDSPFWDLPNVLISPHSASTVHAENARIVDIFLDNLGRFARGEPLTNVADPKDVLAGG